MLKLVIGICEGNNMISTNKKLTESHLDHRLVKAPYIRITSCTKGTHGDVVCLYDLRFTQPNTEYLSVKQLHSIEHALLFGFRKYLPDTFINVAPMGCQTGCYLVLINEPDVQHVAKIYEQILLDILQANEVPYANIRDCGQYLMHSINEAQVLAKKLLNHRQTWLEVM